MLMTGIDEKTCTKCKKTKVVSEFYRKGRTYTSWCKDCVKELSHQRVMDGRDRESKRRYNEKHGIKPRSKTAKKEPEKKEREKVTTLHKMCVEMAKNTRKRALYTQKECDIDTAHIEYLVNEFANNNFCEITLQKKPFKPSIDRIDNSKGYTKENIRICWLIENYCKNTFSDADVLEFCKRKLGVYQD